MPQPQPVSDYAAAHGEGPRWAGDRLLWLDITGKKLIIHRDATPERVIDLPCMPGCVAPVAGGGVVFGWERGFARFNPRTGLVTPIIDPDADSPATRFNDGGTDPAGRFWAGTMGYHAEPGLGRLYRLDHDGRAARVLSGVSISNGIAWAADGTTMYYIDTPRRDVQAFDYDPATGDISNPRTVVRIDIDGAHPDGMAIDGDGNLWIALWDGWAVVCHDPRTGKRLERVDVPAARPTACAFGGPDLRTLYITTSRLGLDASALRDQPLAGRLFSVASPVRGAALPDVVLRA